MHWQGPGGSKLFDSKLDEWKTSKTSKENIYILFFFNELDEPIFKDDVENGIINYFKEKNIQLPGRSPVHYWDLLVYYGFIIQNDNDYLSISEFGSDFLKEINDKNFDNALDLFINQLFEVKYPNKGTPKVSESLRVFPFRILFQLLDENMPHKGIIPIMMFRTNITFINCSDDLEVCLNYLLDDCFTNHMDKIFGYNDKYIKNYYNLAPNQWNSYVINSLKDLGIIKEKNNYIYLSNYKKEIISKNIGEEKYKDLFY